MILCKTTSQHAEEAARPFALRMSIKLCMKTLTALRCVKGMAHLRYLIHTPGLTTTQEDYTVLCLHNVQSFPLTVLVQHCAFRCCDVTERHLRPDRRLHTGVCSTACRGMLTHGKLFNITHFCFDCVRFSMCIHGRLCNSACIMFSRLRKRTFCTQTG